jgi:hypothetical protein
MMMSTENEESNTIKEGIKINLFYTLQLLLQRSKDASIMLVNDTEDRLSLGIKIFHQS